mmetsp:Transcript_4146/g.12015  ORF Transcript_4146/g.12015 Transcript_4146/m.12015 type:complete len:295 (+) Transcript_4146:294-1178(+)
MLRLLPRAPLWGHLRRLHRMHLCGALAMHDLCDHAVLLSLVLGAGARQLRRRPLQHGGQGLEGGPAPRVALPPTVLIGAVETTRQAPALGFPARVPFNRGPLGLGEAQCPNHRRRPEAGRAARGFDRAPSRRSIAILTVGEAVSVGVARLPHGSRAGGRRSPQPALEFGVDLVRSLLRLDARNAAVDCDDVDEAKVLIPRAHLGALEGVDAGIQTPLKGELERGEAGLRLWEAENEADEGLRRQLLARALGIRMHPGRRGAPPGGAATLLVTAAAVIAAKEAVVIAVLGNGVGR